MKKTITKRLLAIILSLSMLTGVSMFSVSVNADDTASETQCNINISTASSTATEWIFEPVDENFSFQYKNWSNNYAPAKGVVYRLKSPNNGKYLTAVYSSRNSGTARLSLVTKPLDESDNSQKWLFYKTETAGSKYYSFSNLGEVADETYPTRYGRIFYSRKNVGISIASDLQPLESAYNAFVLISGVAEKLISDLKSEQGNSFQAKIRLNYPEYFLTEEILPDGAARVYTKASNNVSATTAGVANDKGFKWNIKLDRTENGKNYYTVQSSLNQKYLTHNNGSVYLTEKTDTTSQLWRFDSSASSNFSNATNIYYLKAYNTAQAINTFEKDGTIIPEDEIQFDFIDANSYSNAGMAWAFNDRNNRTAISDELTDVTILTYQWGKGEYYYLYAPTEPEKSLIKAYKQIPDKNVLDKDTGYLWNIEFGAAKNNYNYYTIQNVGTNLYLTCVDGKVFMAPKYQGGNAQYWRFVDVSSTFSQSSYVYDIRTYDTDLGITTIESGAVLSETGLQLKDTTTLSSAGGRAWTLGKNRGKIEAKGGLKYVYINSYQYSNYGDNYYLYNNGGRTIRHGYINEDEKIDILDLIRLKKHIDDPACSISDELAADCNKDKKVGAEDLVALRKYLMGALQF